MESDPSILSEIDKPTTGLNSKILPTNNYHGKEDIRSFHCDCSPAHWQEASICPVRLHPSQSRSKVSCFGSRPVRLIDRSVYTKAHKTSNSSCHNLRQIGHRDFKFGQHADVKRHGVEILFQISELIFHPEEAMMT